MLPKIGYSAQINSCDAIRGSTTNKAKCYRDSIRKILYSDNDFINDGDDNARYAYIKKAINTYSTISDNQINISRAPKISIGVLGSNLKIDVTSSSLKRSSFVSQKMDSVSNSTLPTPKSCLSKYSSNSSFDKKKVKFSCAYVYRFNKDNPIKVGAVP